MTSHTAGVELLAAIRSGDYARIADAHIDFEGARAAEAAADYTEED